MGGRPDGPGPRDKGRFVDKISRELDLSATQKEKLTKLVDKAESEIKDLAEANKGIHDKIRDEMNKDEPDMAALERHIRELSSRRADIELKRLGVIIEFKKELTAEQQEKLKEMHKFHKGNKRTRPGPRDKAPE